MSRLDWILAVTRLWCVSPLTRDQLIEANRPLLASLSPAEKQLAWDEMRRAGT